MSKDFRVAVGIFMVTLLPYIHNIVAKDSGELREWVPDLGIVDFLTRADGSVWGYSDYPVFLYLAGLNASHFLGWFLAMHLAIFKRYRFVLLFPTVLTGYQLLLIVFNLRQTSLNDLNYKIIIILIIGILSILNRFLKKRHEGQQAIEQK